jgi:polyphosphate kinase
MLNIPDRATLPLTDPSLYINRELSWLAFNRRVLAQAEDASHPLLERVRFLSIVGTNLDEFFMIRVSALLRKVRSGVEDVSLDGLSTAEQLARVPRRLTPTSSHTSCARSGPSSRRSRSTRVTRFRTSRISARISRWSSGTAARRSSHA